MAAPAATIRDATAADAAAVLVIYAPFVRDTAVSFELEPPSVDDVAGRADRMTRAMPDLIEGLPGGAS